MQISPRVLVRVASGFLFTLGLFVPLVGFSQATGGHPPPCRSSHLTATHSPPPLPPGGLPKESTDPQVKAVLDQMSAAGLLEPKTLEQASKSFLFYSQFGGPAESIFHVEDRKIPGPAGSLPIRVYIIVGLDDPARDEMRMNSMRTSSKARVSLRRSSPSTTWSTVSF